MADEQNQNPTPPPGTDPLPPANGDTPPTASNPIAQANPEQNSQMIPKHRLDEVITERNEYKKKIAEFEENQKKIEEDRLRKQGEFEKLAQQKEQEAQQWKSKFNDTLLNSELRDHARALGAVDPAAVLQLVDRTGVELADDGTIRGAKEAVEKLLTEKPYLKGTGATPTVGSPTNPAAEQQAQRRFKRSQLRDPNFFRENEKDIMNAFKLGLIEDDTA